MSCETKEQIIETALELFSQNGFLGTSMSDIASQLKITKGALYKHYESKQQILEQIIERMAKLDLERAKKYEMPETEQKNSRKHTFIFQLKKSASTALRNSGIGRKKIFPQSSAKCLRWNSSAARKCLTFIRIILEPDRLNT